MESIKLFVSSDKIKWGMPQSKINLFTSEVNSSVPYKDFSGNHEICRHEKELGGVVLYVTPVFKQGLISLKAFFELDSDMASYRSFIEFIKKEFGEPSYATKEEWKGKNLMGYPCNIWILPDAILEAGIREEAFVALGYAVLTVKDNFKEVYTQEYLKKMGWNPSGL